jgi:hypothetical protein
MAASAERSRFWTLMTPPGDGKRVAGSVSRSRIRRRRATIVAAAGYGAAVILSTWPLATDLGDALIDPMASGIGVGAWTRIDLDLVVWILAWGAHAILTQPFGIFQANILFPAPDTLVGSENLLGLQLIAAPIYWISQNALLTYNVTVLTVVWLAAFGTFLAVRSWTGYGSAAFLAGILFAFAPRVAANFVHLHWSAVALFPIITALLWASARRPRRATLVALALLTAIQIACGVYIAFALAAWLLALLPWVVIEAHRRGRSGLVPIAALAAGAALASPIALPYLRARASGRLPTLATAQNTLEGLSATPAALLGRIADEMTWPVVALACLGVLGTRRPGRRLRLSLLAASGFGVLLGCGTAVPGLYGALMVAVPGFAAIRGPIRFLVLPTLGIALLAGIGTSDVLDRLRFRRAVKPMLACAAVGVAGFLFLAHATLRPLALSPVLSTSEKSTYEWLARHGGDGAALELPAFHSVVERDALLVTGRAMVGSTIHWLPLVNGYTGHWPPSAHLLMELADRLPDRQAFVTLCSLVRLRWIVVHLDRMGAERDAWEDPRAAGLPIRQAARFGDDVVYETTQECGALEPRLLEELEGARRDRTLGDVPLAPLPAAGLRGRLEAELPAQMVGGVLQRVEVEVRNDSDRTWPGLTSHSHGRIGVHVRWHAPDGSSTYGKAPVPLARDLRPGETLRLAVEAVPIGLGSQELEIGLIQEERGWFSDLDGTGSMRGVVQVRALLGGPHRRRKGGAPKRPLPARFRTEPSSSRERRVSEGP